MTDHGFPIIEYSRGKTPRQWGQAHGESYRSGIHELAEIRLGLMQEKNPSMTAERITSLAGEQWQATKAAAPELAEELSGICDGAAATEAQIVILNNYTDFRDIPLPDEGCSVVFSNSQHGPIAGQTWDMHSSAKNYVCVLDIPDNESDRRMVVFSLVGCVGMMGYTSIGTTVGVNNINTDGAVAGMLWPVVVRKTLEQPTQTTMTKYLTTSNVTSGHNYLIASPEKAEMWEVAPNLSECVDSLNGDETGTIFHTNHCLGTSLIKRELPTSQNSTTHIRYELLTKKIEQAKSYEAMYALLNDHENYPKSICSNFQSNANDPSVTCGGAVGHLTDGRVMMWRGDEQYDDNFQKHEFQLQ